MTQNKEQTKESFQQLAEIYRSIAQAMKPGYAVLRIERNDAGGFESLAWYDLDSVFVQLFGGKLQGAVGQSLQDCPLSDLEMADALAGVARTGEDTWYEHQNALTRHLIDCYIFRPYPEYLCVLSHDQTVDKEIRTDLKRYQLLSEHGRDVILYVRQADGQIVEANLAAEKLYGYSKDELLALKIYDLRGDDLPENVRKQMAKSSGNGILFETVHLDKSGHRIDVEVSSRGIEVKGEIILLSIIRDIRQRRSLERERNQAMEKMQESLLRERHLRLELEENNRSLSDSFEAVWKTQSQFVQQEKLAGIGQLAAGVAHEINNPLGFVSSNIEVLKTYVQNITINCEAFEGLLHLLELSGYLAEEVQKIREIAKKTKLERIMQDLPNLVQETLDGTERMAKIVSGLRKFARSDPNEDFSIYDVNDGIRTTLIVARNEIKYYAEIEEDLAEDLPAIEAKGGEINQVLLNIIVNAAQAIQAKNLDAPGIINVKTWDDGKDVYCQVADNGIGMSNEVKQHIIEPFFTTKAIGQGTGLGLSISHEIITNHHRGEIAVASAPNQGSTFTIRLPIKQGDETINKSGIEEMR